MVEIFHIYFPSCYVFWLNIFLLLALKTRLAELVVRCVLVRCEAWNLLTGFSQMVVAWASTPNPTVCWGRAGVTFYFSHRLRLFHRSRKGKPVLRQSRCFTTLPTLCWACTQTTAKTRKHLHQRSIKATHEFWINTLSTTSVPGTVVMDASAVVMAA